MDSPSKFLPKSIRCSIKGKLDETLEIRLNQLLEKANEKKRNRSFLALEIWIRLKNFKKDNSSNFVGAGI